MKKYRIKVEEQSSRAFSERNLMTIYGYAISIEKICSVVINWTSVDVSISDNGAEHLIRYIRDQLYRWEINVEIEEI